MLSHSPPAEYSHPAVVHFHHQAGAFQLEVQGPPTQAADVETAGREIALTPLAHPLRPSLFTIPFYPYIPISLLLYCTSYILTYFSRSDLACPYTVCTHPEIYLPLSCGRFLTGICRPFVLYPTHDIWPVRVLLCTMLSFAIKHSYIFHFSGSGISWLLGDRRLNKL